jgi:predicted secreted protein
LLRELKEYDDAMNERAKENVIREEMYKFMTDYYEKMREEMNLNENYAQDEEEPKLEHVLKTLKPNTTALNFKEHLKPTQNFSKSQHWRAISRKVNKVDEQQAEKANSNAKMMQETAISFFNRPTNGASIL